jgi:histone-lysine N-methyltransferase ASH1L
MVEITPCTCSETCDENCLNRITLLECDEGNCAVGLACGNRFLTQLSHGPTQLGLKAMRTSDRGRGVFATLPFKAGQPIAKLSGLCLSIQQYECRLELLRFAGVKVSVTPKKVPRH